MTFIRAKEIPPHSGNWYDYEVETIHEGNKVRQKVIRYIGKSGTSRSFHLSTGQGQLLPFAPTIPISPCFVDWYHLVC